MRRLEATLTLFVLALLSGAACGDKGTRATPPHPVGAESFVSQPPGGPARGGANSTADGAAGASAPTATPTSATSDGASRTVEEADIYKRVGSTLYVLNAYRGLQIIDLADLAAPRLLARVPVAGRPVDLYVRDNTAFVAVSDFFVYLAAADGTTRPERGSRVVAVDVSAASHPVVLAELPIEGEIQQTRLVGDVLYVVSRNTGWYDWVGPSVAGGTASTLADAVAVASFDLSDPTHPRPAGRLELPASGWDTHANVTAERITLSFAGWGPDGQVTHFRVVDISDPTGALVAGAEFSRPGLVKDRWGMDFDAASGLFRAVLASATWNGGAAFQIWSSPTPDAAQPLSSLSIDVQESLTAAGFDGSRAYIVTALRTDPLWVVDARDPANPLLAGKLTMPGQLDFIEPRGDRLVALGLTNEAGQPFQLAASLFDVADLASPKLLSRATFGASFGWVSATPDDLRKAFLVFDPPPAGIGLVLVPVQGWDQKTYAFSGGTQLLDFARDAVTLRGFLSHPGAVTRSFPADDAGTRLVALSDSALQTIDAANRDAPRELARLDLARSVTTLTLVHGKAIELCGDWYRGAMELAVTDALDPEAASPIARVSAAAPTARMFPDGDVMWILANDSATQTAWLQAVDVNDPVHPVLRGRLDLAPEDGVGGYRRWWGFGDEAVLVGHALAIHRGFYLAPVACPAGSSCPLATADQVRVYDLAEPDHPRLAATVDLADSAWSWGLYASGSYLWLTHFEWEPQASEGRYYVDRIDLSDPAHPKLLAKINVPGVFFAASEDGRRVFTAETWWKDDLTTTWVHGLQLTDTGKARLYGSAGVQGYPSGTAARAGFAWIAASDWSGSQNTSRLAAVDLGAMAVTDAQVVQGGWTWLRLAAGGKLFLQAGWQDQGILIYGLGNPAHPHFEQFFRTQEWVWDIVVDGGYAYLPSGPYGVPMVTLAAP